VLVGFPAPARASRCLPGCAADLFTGERSLQQPAARPRHRETGTVHAQARSGPSVPFPQVDGTPMM
jgi:hypothetical protein